MRFPPSKSTFASAYTKNSKPKNTVSTASSDQKIDEVAIQGQKFAVKTNLKLLKVFGLDQIESDLSNKNFS